MRDRAQPAVVAPPHHRETTIKSCQGEGIDDKSFYTKLILVAATSGVSFWTWALSRVRLIEFCKRESPEPQSLWGYEAGAKDPQGYQKLSLLATFAGSISGGPSWTWALSSRKNNFSGYLNVATKMS